MPADSVTTAQLHALRGAIEADVIEAVHDEAVRRRLLQTINARFQTFTLPQHDGSAVEEHDGGHSTGPQESGKHSDRATWQSQQPHEEVTEGRLDGQEQQQQQHSNQTAENAMHPTAAANSAKSSKRKKKKSAASRVESDQSAEQGNTSGSSSAHKQVVQGQPPPPWTPPPPQSQLPLSTPSPSAERDADLLPTTDASVELDYTERSGRLLRAGSGLPAGTRLLDDRGYAAVVKLERCRELCALCHSLLDDGAGRSKLPCGECRVAHYCSARCQRIDASYRHTTECRMLAAVGQLSRSVSVDVDLLQMLAAVCARQHRERHREQYPSCSTGVADEQDEAARWRDDELVSQQSHNPDTAAAVACDDVLCFAR